MMAAELMGKSERTKVFISYSHKDIDAFERLRVHLTPLERRLGLDWWADTKIDSGQIWRSEIKRALNEALVAILLVSADFLASDFIAREEVPPLLIAAEEEGLVVLPVILKPCAFDRTPELERYQAVNSPSQPLFALKEIEQERLNALARSIAPKH